MKKRVRIYKAPNGEGKFVNKTAQFLKKAQEGGVPDPSMMGYPGGKQQPQQQLTEDQLASIILKDIGAGLPREGIVVKLVNVFGREPNEAMQFVDQMYQYVEQQQQTEIDNAQEEDADSEEIVADEDAADVAPQPQPQEPVSPTGTQMSNEMALEDAPDDDDTDVASSIVMQYGGYYRAQEGMEVPIEMPDMSAYMPEGMTNYYGDPNAASDIAWAPPEMESTDDVEGSMNAYKGFVAPEMPEDIAIGSAKYGGSKQSKKQFVNSVLKLVKKQMGGDSENPKSAGYTDDNADPTGSGIRKKNLNKFIGSIKNETAVAAAKEQAEKHYDQMMQQKQQPPMQQYPVAQNGGEQDIYQGQDYENPMHHLQAFSQATGDVFKQDQNQMTQAQYGIQIGDENCGPRGCFGPIGPNSTDLTAQELELARIYGINDPGFSVEGTRNEIKDRQRQEWIDNQMKSGNTGYDDMIRGIYPKRSQPMPNVYGSAPGMNPFNVQPNPLGRFMGGYRMPAGLQGMPPITRLDVRRSGLFGRPRRYTAEFGQYSPMPGMGMPGQGVGFYGYGAKVLRWPATRTKVVSEAVSVNKKALEEVANATPTSTATTNVADPNVTTTVSTTTQGTVSTETKPGDLTQTQTVTTDGKTETNPTNPVVVKPTVVNKDKIIKEKGDGIYSYPGKTGIYQKKDGAWYIDPTGTGQKYQPLKSGDVKARIKALETNATPYKKPEQQVIKIPVNTENRPDLVRDATRIQTNIQPLEFNKPNFSTSRQIPNPSGYQPPVMYQRGTNPNPAQPVMNPLTGQPLPAQYWQVGGSTSANMMGDNGQLQRFVYGGDDYDDITQGDIDDVYSKDTANGDFPMAQYGRIVRNYFPANIMPQQYAQMQRGPYNPQTGQAQQFIPGAGTHLKSIDVKKSSWLTGAPKKYTITYGNEEMDPRKQNLITLPGSGTQTPESLSRQPERQHSNVEGLGMRAKMAIRHGENQMNRNDRRLARHPELLESDYMPAQPQFIDERGSNPGVDPQKAMEYMHQSLSLPNVPPAIISAPIPTSTPFSADQLYNMSGPMNTEMRYGGGLRRFLPRADGGAESPVTFTNNPALAGMTDVDMISLNPGIQGLDNSALTGFMNTNAPTRDQSQDPAEIKIDPNQIESHQAEKVYSGTPGDTSIDFKTKNVYDPDAMLNVANAGIRGVTGMIDRSRNKKNEAKMYDNLNADNLYASDPSKDRGDYDANTGLFRMDEQGQQWNSRSKKYGGNIYQDGGMVEGDEIFMTDEEIQEFLANGGDLEFI
jgi:hypothetical protein